MANTGPPPPNAADPLADYARLLRSNNTVANNISRINATNTSPSTPNAHKVIGNRALKNS